MNPCFIFLIFIFFVFSNNVFAEQETICSPTECYRIVKLGEGGFGKVYAVENSSRMPFAIKSHKKNMGYEMSPGVLGDAEGEFSRGQTLNHPNIIKSHDLFTAFISSMGQTTNIVLDLVEGKTLNSTERGAISGDISFKASMQLIDALQYWLSFDLIYFDLHGGNLMLDDQSNLMVIDLESFFSIDEIPAFVFNKSATITRKEQPSAPTPQDSPQESIANRNIANSSSVFF